MLTGGLYGSAPGTVNPDLWVFRVDAEGDTLWNRVWGEEFNDLMVKLTTKGNGNPLVASALRHFEDDEAHGYLAELDATDGSFVWQREYGPPIVGTSFAIAKEVAPGSGHIAVGGLFDDIGGYDSGIMLRTSDAGDSLWMRTFYYHDSLVNYGWGYLRDVVSTLDGGFIACGTSHGEVGGPLPPGYSQDVWIVKVDSLGCIVPGCDIPMITTQITNMGYALNVYPNPLSPSKGQGQLHVGINLPAGFKTEGPLNLSVVGMDGKLVRQEVVPTSQPNELVLDVTGLAPGAYTIHLSDAHTWIAGKNFVVE